MPFNFTDQLVQLFIGTLFAAQRAEKNGQFFNHLAVQYIKRCIQGTTFIFSSLMQTFDLNILDHFSKPDKLCGLIPQPDKFQEDAEMEVWCCSHILWLIDPAFARSSGFSPKIIWTSVLKDVIK